MDVSLIAQVSNKSQPWDYGLDLGHTEPNLDGRGSSISRFFLGMNTPSWRLASSAFCFRLFSLVLSRVTNRQMDDVWIVSCCTRSEDGMVLHV